MKKHYLLALMAGVVCGMSAQTRIQTPPQAEKQAVPMTRVQQPVRNVLKANAPSGLLRAADIQVKPDSIYYPNSEGGYDKDYYKYTEEGLTSEILKYQYLFTDGGGGDYFRMYTKYEYDEHGHQLRYVYENGYAGTVLTLTYENTYDEQGRLSSVYTPALTPSTKTSAVMRRG